jgi:hypothetical protein
MNDSVARAIRKAAGLEQAAMSGSRAMSFLTRETAKIRILNFQLTSGTCVVIVQFQWHLPLVGWQTCCTAW